MYIFSCKRMVPEGQPRAELAFDLLIHLGHAVSDLRAPLSGRSPTPVSGCGREATLPVISLAAFSTKASGSGNHQGRFIRDRDLKLGVQSHHLNNKNQISSEM